MTVGHPPAVGMTARGLRAAARGTGGRASRRASSAAAFSLIFAGLVALLAPMESARAQTQPAASQNTTPGSNILTARQLDPNQ